MSVVCATTNPPQSRADRVREFLDSLPPEVEVSGVVFADEMEPELRIVDYDIDADWCWVIELRNETLAERNQYPVWIAGQGPGAFFDAMAATGPGAYNACVLQAQQNCPGGKVCWVSLVGPNQTCIWNCKGSAPCKPNPNLTYADVLEFVTLD